MKIIEGAVGMLILLFFGWVFVAGTPRVRLQRACAPVSWAGRASLASVALVHPEWERGTQHFFVKTDYDCQYILWSQFYESTWQRLKQQKKAVGKSATEQG